MTKKKSLRVFGLGVLMLFVSLTLVSFASAAISLSTSSITLDQFGTGQTFTISNSVASPINVSLTSQTITDSKGNIATITFNPTGTVLVPASGSVTVTANASVPTNFILGASSKSYLISEVGNPSNNVTLTLNVKNTLCTFRDDGNLDVSIDDVKVLNGFGSDITWYPLDEIEVKVDVANNGNDTIRSIVVKWELYDITAQKRILKGEESSFSLKDGDDKTLNIDFQLESSSLKGGDSYIFYVWATGKDEAFSGSPSTCMSTDNVASNLGSLDITIDSNLVILSSLEIVGTPSCGTTVQISGKVWNIGEDDEQDVYLKVYNTELGISQRVNIGDIDSLESKDLLFDLIIPEDAQEGKSYELTFLVYDENDDIFESSNGDQARFTLSFTIASGSCTTEVSASVTAVLETTAKAGQEFSIRATITNTASVQKTFNVELSDYATWSSFVSLDKTSVTLAPGASTDVLIMLKANDDVSGSQSFSIILRDGTKSLTQPVSVSVQGKGFSITGLFAGLGGNAYLWAIGALNVILVLIIIIVAVRVVRKK